MSSTPESLTALEAREKAQWIAFAPFVFQASRVLRDSGILGLLEREPALGLGAEEVAQRLGLPPYGVRVLLDAALAIGLATEESHRYRATKVARFLTHDTLTRVNMDFTRDVNYAGLARLGEAIETGGPAGLRALGPWPTIYEALADLPSEVRRSWRAFNHYYSDRAFPAALPLVFRRRPQRLLDIGGNSGRWAAACLRYDTRVHVSVLDLPHQVEEARQTLRSLELGARADFIPADLLDESVAVPSGYDAIWMSQFLDCLSQRQIVSILSRCRDSLSPTSYVYILEPFSDRQRFAAGAFCLRMTSLYFTVMANGNSCMYRSDDFIDCVREAGLAVKEQHDQLGVCHTLLVCSRR